MQKTMLIVLLVLFCFGIGRMWYWATDGFRIARIWGCSGTGQERELSVQAQQALAQRYFYLGRGRQCFAFQSEDGQYVLKLPRLDRYQPRLWFRCFSLGQFKVGMERSMNNTVTRKKKLFQSFDISYAELKEDAALIAMFKASHLKQPIEIVDRLGRTFRLPLDQTDFILQRKLALFKDVFQEAWENKDRQRMDNLLDQLLQVVIRTAKKGILSKDGAFLSNFGFDETRAYQLDIGSFYRKETFSESEAFVASVHASVDRLQVWLLDLDPSLAECFNRKLREVGL